MSRDFSVASSRITLPVSLVAFDGDTITIAAWVWLNALPSGGPGNACVIEQSDTNLGGTIKAFYLRVEGSGNVHVSVGDGSNHPFGGSIGTGSWQHLILRKDGTGGTALQGWINGSQVCSGSGSQSVPNNADVTPVMGDTGTRPGVNGFQAETAIWDVALTDAELVALSKGLNPMMLRPGNLRGYWPLWGSDSPERDYSGRGNTGTLANSPGNGRHAPVMPFMVPLGTQESFKGATVSTDSDTVYLDLQASGVESQQPFADADTVYFDLQPSSVENRESLDSDTVYFDLQPSGTEYISHVYIDSATVNFRFSVQGGECYTTAVLQTEGEAYQRWTADMNYRWLLPDTKVRSRWAMSVSRTSEHC
jgi:hypothetical protein